MPKGEYRIAVDLLVVKNITLPKSECRIVVEYLVITYKHWMKRSRIKLNNLEKRSLNKEAIYRSYSLFQFSYVWKGKMDCTFTYSAFKKPERCKQCQFYLGSLLLREAPLQIERGS